MYDPEIYLPMKKLELGDNEIFITDELYDACFTEINATDARRAMDFAVKLRELDPKIVMAAIAVAFSGEPNSMKLGFAAVPLKPEDGNYVIIAGNYFILTDTYLQKVNQEKLHKKMVQVARDNPFIEGKVVEKKCPYCWSDIIVEAVMVENDKGKKVMLTCPKANPRGLLSHLHCTSPICSYEAFSTAHPMQLYYTLVKEDASTE